VITVLGLWESLWFEGERTERRIWKQTIQAFGVRHWAMCGINGGPFSSPAQFPDVESMLAAYPGRRTFLIPPGRVESVDLVDYSHPPDAIYVFGNTTESLARYVTPNDDVVSIHTAAPVDLFPYPALGAVLYDRMAKS